MKRKYKLPIKDFDTSQTIKQRRKARKFSEKSLHSKSSERLNLISLLSSKNPIPSSQKGETKTPCESFRKRLGKQPSKIKLKKKLVLPATASAVSQAINLSKFEQSEIQNYKKVYYVTYSRNENFHSPEGDYNVLEGEQIAYRYEVVSLLGQGSFGVVVKAYDHKDHQEVAIKIVKKQQEYSEQAHTEIEILNFLKERDRRANHSIVKIMHSFLFRNHVCIVFELLNISLFEYMIYSYPSGFPAGTVKSYAVQILEALTLQHRYNILHCDLKPENILLSDHQGSTIKIIDYGSSCFFDDRIFTYLQSRFYRSPEVILGIDYSVKIDMWSLGCIIVEFLTGNPLFLGENEAELLQSMIEVLGFPPPDVLEAGTKTSSFFAGGKINYERKKTRNLEELVHDPALLTLVKGCLEWDTKKRISAKNALEIPGLNPSQAKGTKRTPSFKLTRAASENSGSFQLRKLNFNLSYNN